MSEPSLIERQRAALHELARLQAEKAATLEGVEQAARTRLAAAATELDQTRARIARRAEAEQAAAQQQLEAARAAATQRCATELTAARQAHAAARDESERRREDAHDRAIHAYEESRWTTITMCEAVEKTVKGPLERVEHEVGLARQKVQELAGQAEAVVRRWRHAGLLRRPPPPGRVNRHHDQLPRNLSACLVDAEYSLKRLQALLVPRLFQSLHVLWLPLVLWAMLAGLLLALYPGGLVAGRHHWLEVSIPGAILLALALAALFYIAARVKVHRAYRPVRVALADAELTCQRWEQQAAASHAQRLAEVEAARRRRDTQLAEIEEKHQRILAALQERHERELGEAEAHYPPLIRALEPARDEAIRQAEQACEQALTASRTRATAAYRQADDGHQREVAQAQAGLGARREQLAADQARAMTKLRDGTAQVIRECGRLFPPWKHPSWTSWTPPTTLPAVLRFGDMQVDLQAQLGTLRERLPEGVPAKFNWPALLAFPRRASVLLKARDAGRAAAVGALQALMFRLLTALPAGKVRFTIIDPVGLGENFAAFMHLADHDEALVSSRIWTEPAHIEQRLADLSAHMENVIQKYLRNQYASIEDYNAQAGEVAEPYRVLVIANFPVNFTPDAARRLVSIVTSGASCGVITLLGVDAAQALPEGCKLADLEPHCLSLAWKDGRFTWADADFAALPLQLDAPPEPALANRLLAVIGEHARRASRVEVPFDFIAPATGEWWRQSSRDGIDVPLGRAGATKRQCLRLGQGTAQHGLVAGKTGSGKSTLFHVLVTNLALLYSPDEVELYLVDFKKGVEFKTYATHRLPHARVIAVESEREFGLSVLQRLDAELRQRGDTFRGLGVPNLKEYREKTGKPCPRILLLVDEFQEFFVEDDRIAQEAALLLDRLVRQGRAFGLHLVLGSQTLGGAYTLARSTIDQMAVRIALQCSEADAHLILSKDNAAARLLGRPGEAIYNDANGLVEGNNVFQIVWMDDDRRDQMLEQARRLAGLHQLRPAGPPVVFEGNLPADIRTNVQANRLLAEPAWPAPPRAAFAWLGEAIAIKDPTAAVFRRQAGSNLLVIGQQEEAALGVLATALVSLAGQFVPSPDTNVPAAGARFFIVDGTPGDSPHAGAWQRVASVLPHSVQTAGWRELPGILNEIAAEVDRRQKANDTEAPAVFLVVYGLQRFKDLRKQDDDFSFGRRGEDRTVPPAQQFSTILREGPALGVHVLVWCDGLNSLQRVCDRAMLRDFEMRVLFQMSVNDSSFLIDSPQAAKLGLHRALYSSEEAGAVEKFRPYGLPPEEWLANVRKWLSAKRPAQPAPASVRS